MIFEQEMWKWQCCKLLQTFFCITQYMKIDLLQLNYFEYAVLIKTHSANSTK